MSRLSQFQINDSLHFPVDSDFPVLSSFTAYLKNIKLQIIGFFIRPENRVIRCLCSVFHLTETLMHISCSLSDGLGKQFICHKMRTGTGSQKSSVFHEFHRSEINLAVSFYRIFYRTSGFRKGRRIQNYHIKLLSPLLQLRKKFKS